MLPFRRMRVGVSKGIGATEELARREMEEDGARRASGDLMYVCEGCGSTSGCS